MLLRYCNPFMIGSGFRGHAVPDRPVRLWAIATASAAALVSIADAALIGRTRGIFSGGFLSPEHLDTWGERGAFAAVSLLSDAAVAGILAGLALIAARHLRLRRLPAALLSVSVAAGPLLIADIISYELLAHLGDAFDVALMFDLSGRSIHELLAVSSAHLVEPAILIGGAMSAVAAAVFLTQRATSGSAVQGRPSSVIAAMLLMAGFGAQVWARTSSDVLDDALRRKPTGRIFGMIAETLADVDRDGYGVLRQPRDPAWRDGAVYPYAVDWPGDGIDQDGLAGDLPAVESEYTEPDGQAPAFTSRPDVLFVVLESYRADAVGSMLNGKPVTPALDELARTGASSRQAYSHNGYTTNSRRHIFAGSLADIRGEQTLIDDFRANGYEVAYFSGQDESFGGEAVSIHPERADVFYDARQDAARRYSTFTSAGSLAVPYEVVLERVSAFLRARDRARPLFLYVNFHDTHFPYWHQKIRTIVDGTVLPQGDINPDRQDDLRRMYLNTASNVDAAIGSLLQSVRANVGEPPAVIVTSDHGESLFDQGFLGHGYALNEAQTRVPLVVHGLPAEIVEPFAQSSIRGLIWQALTATDRHAAPVVRTREDGAVFQYLGNLDRPRQIALTDSQGRRRSYDFREDRMQVGEGPWKPLAALDASESRQFVDLVRYWERVRLAAAREDQRLETRD